MEQFNITCSDNYGGLLATEGIYIFALEIRLIMYINLCYYVIIKKMLINLSKMETPLLSICKLGYVKSINLSLSF